MIDFNCFVGNWPFYKLRKHSFEDLKLIHNENGINSGYVSSLQSVFYNDFYESEKDLFEQIKGTQYKQVVTVNPTLSTCTVRLLECIKNFRISGIRLVPGYHGYNVSSDITDGVMELAKKYNLPIFVSARLTDERLTHFFHPEALKMDDVCSFAKRNSQARIILNYIKDDEVKVLCSKSNVFYDVCGLSEGFLSESSHDILKNAVYGSGFPLRTLKSSLLLMNEVSDEKLRFDVLSGMRIDL